MSGRLPMERAGFKPTPLHVPDRWREGGSEMLLPQGSILANWVLATMSSRGMASLSAPTAPVDSNLGARQPASRRSADRMGQLCRKLGADDADQFLRDLLEKHFAGDAT